MVDGYRPEDLAEALRILAEEDCLPVSGATDLMVQYARGTGLRPDFKKALLFISHLKELQYIKTDQRAIRIGSAVTLTTLLEHPGIPGIFKEILRQMAAAPTRHMATLAGNIGNASPAADTLPYLYATDAELLLQSSERERIVTVADFISGPKKTIRKNDELIKEIRIPLSEFNIEKYRKLGQRKGMSLTKASFLGLAKTRAGKIEDVRIALGSVAALIVRSPDTEKKIAGKNIHDVQRSIEEILNDYDSLIRPIDDARSTALYRKRVSLRLIRDFIDNLH